MAFVEKVTIIKKYKLLLKNDVTSFLVSFRRKYNVFPIKLLNELSKNSSYSNIKKLLVNGVSIEPNVLAKDVNNKYKGLKKKINPSYFNPTLKSFTKDALKCKDESEIKVIYKNYSDELKRLFKDMNDELSYCVESLKAINIALKSNKRKENDDE